MSYHLGYENCSLDYPCPGESFTKKNVVVCSHVPSGLKSERTIQPAFACCMHLKLSIKVI